MVGPLGFVWIFTVNELSDGDTYPPTNHYVKIKKYHFCCPEFIFLGHEVSIEGVRADPAKTEALCDYPVPRNLKEVQRFLSLTGLLCPKFFNDRKAS